MDHFRYKDGTLYAEDCSLAELAELYGTPFYCYSLATLQRHYRVFSAAVSRVCADALVCFSVKSNSNLGVLNALAALGAGADCVSEGEIRRALAAGVPAEKMIYAGVGKTDDEMRFALHVGILQFNVESLPELRRLSAVAVQEGKTARVAFRVNPDVDAGTHHKISTGRKGDKFGVAFESVEAAYAEAAALPGIEIHGLAMHIGSQITSLEPFRKAFASAASLTYALLRQGYPLKLVDLGGGLGVPYAEGQPSLLPEEYASVVGEMFAGVPVTLAFEPGRMICANAGVMVAKTLYVKDAGDSRFVIVDAAMNDLIRPAFYDAYHEILPVIRQEARPLVKADVAGPVCETGDVFAKAREMALPDHGDLLAFRSCGAYGAVMGSNYNTRLNPPEVMVSGDKSYLLRARQSYEDLLGRDLMLPAEALAGK